MSNTTPTAKLSGFKSGDYIRITCLEYDAILVIDEILEDRITSLCDCHKGGDSWEWIFSPLGANWFHPEDRNIKKASDIDIEKFNKLMAKAGYQLIDGRPETL